MPHTFTLVHRVEFADTDMAGIIHFSSYFRYMEITEHAFLRSLGYSVADRASGIGWPRVDVGCEFRAPLRFEDEVEAELSVTRKGARSLSYRFVFRKLGPEPVVVATGHVTAVCVRMDASTGTLQSAPIPDALADQIEVAPAP